MRRLFVVVAALVALAPAADAQPPTELTIYSSLPLVGPLESTNRDIVRAERLALSEAGGRAGPYAIRFISLNGGTEAAGTWTPRRTSTNGSRAARDGSAIAYLGEFNSAATAVSLPLTNEGGILHLSPSNTYVGLTRTEAADLGEPDKYYPTGVRTYARVAPADHHQAAALVDYLTRFGIERVLLVGDGELYGRQIVRMVGRRLQERGVVGVGELVLRGRASIPAIRRRVRRRRAEAVVFGGTTRPTAIRLFNRMHRRYPRLRLFGSDGVADTAFARGLTRAAARRTRITSFPLPATAYADQSFHAAFRARHGHEPSPYAVFGYEAMRLTLDAIAAAGIRPDMEALRSAVIDNVYATRDRGSVLGTYSIDENGDTSLASFGGYRIVRGRLAFDQVLQTSG